MANASKKSRSVRATFDAVDLDNEGSPRSGFDAVTALTVYLIFLLLIPSDLVVPGLGNLGAPAILWGFVCLLWWTWHSLTRRERFSRWSPVEVAVIVSDQRMPGMLGVELLRELKVVAPNSVRMLLNGYSDLAAFSRSFHREFGVSPRNWRQINLA